MSGAAFGRAWSPGGFHREIRHHAGVLDDVRSGSRRKRYWRGAPVVFFNYGLDTGTVGESTPAHEPILSRHVSWERHSPDREVKERSPSGWLFYRRLKTGKPFHRPMNRVVHALEGFYRRFDADRRARIIPTF